MRIGVNALLMAGARAGIGNVIYNLLKALAKVDKNNTYSIFAIDEGETHEWLGPNQQVVPVDLQDKGSWARILWEQLVLPSQTGKYHVDIMHFADYALPVLFNKVPTIITVHDLAYKLYPETFSKGKLWTKLALIKPSLHKAAKIITVSENTKRDVMELYRIPEEKIAVIYNGVNLERFYPLPPAEVKNRLTERYGLEQGYILFIGTLEPRKNIRTVIKAYYLVRQQGIKQKLVIGGGKGWLYSDIYKLVQELNLVDHVIFTGYLPEEDLPLLYNGAGVFVYPSLYEGFGLPPLEAMACGTPVVTSAVSSLPEVVGDAGLLIQPTEEKALAEAISQVLLDKKLAAELKVRGVNRAQKFTWEQAAEKTLKVYQEVYDTYK